MIFRKEALGGDLITCHCLLCIHKKMNNYGNWRKPIINWEEKTIFLKHTNSVFYDKMTTQNSNHYHLLPKISTSLYLPLELKTQRPWNVSGLWRGNHHLFHFTSQFSNKAGSTAFLPFLLPSKAKQVRVLAQGTLRCPCTPSCGAVRTSHPKTWHWEADARVGWFWKFNTARATFSRKGKGCHS